MIIGLMQIVIFIDFFVSLLFFFFDFFSIFRLQLEKNITKHSEHNSSHLCLVCREKQDTRVMT